MSKRPANSATCNFHLGMTKDDFESIVLTIAKRYKRIIKINVVGSLVKGVVISLTGSSVWDFALDFNDKGYITGEYHLISDNSDSNVPCSFAERIKEAITAFPNWETHLLHRQDDTYDLEIPYRAVVSEGPYHKLLMNYINRSRELDKKSDTIQEYKKKYIRTAIAIPIIIVALFVIFAGILQISKKTKPQIAVNFDSDAVTDVMLVDVVNMFSKSGFTNIKLQPSEVLSSDEQFDEGKVKSIIINGDGFFKKGDKYKSDAEIIITYYALQKIEIPFSSEEFFGKSKDDVVASLKNAGFLNIKFFPIPNQWMLPNNSVINIRFDDAKNLEKGLLVRPDVLIIIYFNSEKGSE